MCNATNGQGALRTGTSTAVGMCVTPKPAGAACIPGQGKLVAYGSAMWVVACAHSVTGDNVMLALLHACVS